MVFHIIGQASRMAHATTIVLTYGSPRQKSSGSIFIGRRHHKGFQFNARHLEEGGSGKDSRLTQRPWWSQTTVNFRPKVIYA